MQPPDAYMIQSPLINRSSTSNANPNDGIVPANNISIAFRRILTLLFSPKVRHLNSQPKSRSYIVNLVILFTIWLFINIIYLCGLPDLILQLGESKNELKALEPICRIINRWRWELIMPLVLLYVCFITSEIISISIFLISHQYPLHAKGLYVVCTLKQTTRKQTIRNSILLMLVNLSWILFFPESYTIKNVWADPILNALGFAIIIWQLKTLIVTALASNFYFDTFFDRKKESIILNGILQVLHTSCTSKGIKGLDVNGKILDEIWNFESENIALPHSETLHRVRLYSRQLKYEWREFLMEKAELTTERARMCATEIFAEVTKGKWLIEIQDLLRYLSKEEVCTLLPLFVKHLQDGKLNEPAFQDGVVEAYREKKILIFALQRMEKLVQNLHILAGAFAAVIIIIISFVVMGLPANSVLFMSTYQILMFGYISRNTCKIVLKSIIFVFMKHPFDIGDHCVIDGGQMIVEEMNILSTVFLRLEDGANVQYPNADLLRKTICNYSRSSDMSEMVEFFVDASTSEKTIGDLGNSIQAYLESNPQHWHPNHELLVKERDCDGQMKMHLQVTRKINFQNFPEKNKRRSELFLALKKIFDTHGMKYHILP